MVNKEILGGLESAVERGENLTDAMNSFLNAGYKKPEIEEAAKALKQGGSPKSQPPASQGQEAQTPKKRPVKKTMKKRPKKRVSNYEGKKKSKGTPTWLIIAIVVAGLVLVGTLIAYFILA